jgi:hypothetical protein
LDEDEAAWPTEIANNTRTLLASRPSFTLQDQLPALLGKAFGLAREKHIRTALKSLYTDGIIANDPKGKLQRFAVKRAG